MKRKYLFSITAGFILITGFVAFIMSNSAITIDDLDEMVVENSQVGERFEITDETFANSSTYNNSDIVLRAHRRFADDNGTVILSSATVYSSAEAAERVRISFIEDTADNVSTASFGDGDIVKIYQDALFKDVVYFYRQKGTMIYFVSVASESDYEEEKARELMKEMKPRSRFSRAFS